MTRFKQLVKSNTSGYIYALTEEGQLVRLHEKGSLPLTFIAESIRVETLKGETVQATVDLR